MGELFKSHVVLSESNDHIVGCLEFVPGSVWKLT